MSDCAIAPVCPRPSAEDDARAETAVVAALRAGDEAAFVELFERYSAAMKHMARSYVASEAVAEEIVQETWVAVVSRIKHFERRSSLSTWMFSILIKQAKTHHRREGRATPFSSLATDENGGFDIDRFQGDGDAWPGRWATPPRPWQRPERRLMSLEARERLREALALLPERQRRVVVLRDVEGLPAADVCRLLEVSPENQRVLLHRGRATMRRALERYLLDSRPR